MEPSPGRNPRLQREPVAAPILLSQVAAAGCGVIALETALRSGLPVPQALPFGLLGASCLALVLAYRLRVGWADRAGRVVGLMALASGAWLFAAHGVRMTALMAILALIWLAQAFRRDEPDTTGGTGDE